MNASNGTMPIFRNGTPTCVGDCSDNLDPSWMEHDSQPFDIYEAGVGGVMLVGAVFACGLVLALAYVAWQVVACCADSTVSAILACEDACRKRACGCRRRRQKTNPDDDLEDEDHDDEAVDARKTRTYVTDGVAE